MKRSVRVLLALVSVSFFLISCKEQIVYKPDHIIKIKSEVPEKPNFYEVNIYNFDPSRPKPTIFFFHGAGGNADSWKSVAPLAIGGGNDFCVISISLGDKWLLTKPGMGPASGQMALFMGPVMNVLAMYVPNDPSRRILFGYSMGGDNALELLLETPAYFGKVILLSPAIFPISPFSPHSEILKYLERSNALTLRKRIKALLDRSDSVISYILPAFQSIAQYYSGEAEWQANDPIARIKSASFPVGLEVFISVGDNDPYGLREGATDIYRELERKSVTVQIAYHHDGHQITIVPQLKHFINSY